MILTMLYESQFIASVLMIIFIALAIILQIILIILLIKTWKEFKAYEKEFILNDDTV